MGQYYHPASLNTLEHLSAHDFDNGLKLMEHSYIGNNFVAAVEMLLIEGGRWDKHQIVWSGDYADGEPKDSPYYTKNSEGGNESVNLHSLFEDSKKLRFLVEAAPPDHIYLVNFDKKQYVNKTKVLKGENDWAPIHPLPLLTAEGNGRGGGDFRGEDPKGLIGSWARNSIGLRNAIPEGFTELVFDLVEE